MLISGLLVWLDGRVHAHTDHHWAPVNKAIKTSLTILATVLLENA